MKNILILIVCSLLLINCSSRIALGTKCTKVSQNGSFERSWLWLKSDRISEEEFKRRVSADYCPKKVVKKS